MPHDVFISYAQTDRAAAEAVCHRLEGAGIRCWIAPRDIGDDWDRNSAVVQAVGGSKLAVVIISASADASRSMLDEVTVILDAEVTIIPFRVEEIRPGGRNADRLHWLDALSEPLNAHIDRLIDRVRDTLSGPLLAADADDPLPAAAVPAPRHVPEPAKRDDAAIPRFTETAPPETLESAARPLTATVTTVISDPGPPPFPETTTPAISDPGPPPFPEAPTPAAPEPGPPPLTETATPPAPEPAPRPFIAGAPRPPLEPAKPPRRRFFFLAVLAAVAAASVLGAWAYQTGALAPHKPSASEQAMQVPPAPPAPSATTQTPPKPAPEPKPAAEPKPPSEPKPLSEPKPASEPKLVPPPLPPATSPKSLTVAGNSEAAPIEIPAPTDPNYPASQLSVTVTGLPSIGTVVMSNGTSPVAVNQTLTSAELTGLMFIPKPDVANQDATLSYKVQNPAGLSADGRVSVVIGPKRAEPSPAEVVAKGIAAFDRKDYAEAMRWYRIAADQGNADAQVHIGELCAIGAGVTQDYAEAMGWFRLAADQGNAQGQKNVGLFFLNGWGVKQDYVEAKRWLRIAAKQGDARAQDAMGYLYLTGHGVARDYDEAMRWFRLAADQGDASGQVSIGRLYNKGLGVEQNYTEALRWFRLAADQGNAKAQASIGYLYETGHGVKQDYAEAMRWFRLAADQGNAQAQSNIGALYANGWGVERDPAQAREWMEKAASAADPYAKKWLASH